MGPSTTSSKPSMATRSGSRLAAAASQSREATPTAAKPGPVVVAKSNIEVDSVFKSDLTNIRSLITCSICDQLLYEPWTLSCGHTYCYSCLCSWFVPNRRKKTCPECRDLVKQIPAPSFLVKQLVEIFINRSELMPSDESTEQHEKRRAEETKDVEQDRESADGLFKGAFPPPNRELIFDEQDGVLRCPRCLTEHEGGPTCTNCFLPVDNGYDFSDMDDDQFDGDIDPEDLELDMDSEVAGYYHHFGHFIGVPHFGFQHFQHPHHHHHHHPGESVTTNSEDDDFSGGSEDDDEDEDEDSSLQDFIVRDDIYPPPNFDAGSARGPRSANSGVDDNSNNAHPITISDDDSDEGGPIRTGQLRRPLQAMRSLRRSRPTVIELSSSETGDLSEDATVLRNAGWSPLSQENDTDPGESEENYGYDTETMGNRVTDDDGDDDDRSRSELSETPTTHYFYGEPTPSNASESHYDEGDDLEEGTPSAIDHDGDTEMSASPRASRGSRSPSVNAGQGYGYDTSESLGATAQVYNADEDSSDESIVIPAPRPRRHRPAQPVVRSPTYDPRISMMFAEHQQNMRGGQGQHAGLSELDGEAQRVEPASRARRRNGSRYRVTPRRGDILRSPTYPSVDRVISSSMRAARSPRQYQRRN